MTWLSTAWIALALGMDAFAVAVAATSAGHGDGPRAAFRLSFHFGVLERPLDFPSTSEFFNS